MKLNNLESFLLDYAIKFENKFKEKIIENNLYATDNLYNTFSVDVNLSEKSYNISVNIADYYKYIESGRKPNSKFPPLSVIREWIRVKPIIPRSINGVTPTNNQLAYLIGRSIAKKGIEAKPLMANTIQELNEELYDGINNAIQLDVKEHINNSFSKINKYKL